MHILRAYFAYTAEADKVETEPVIDSQTKTNSAAGAKKEGIAGHRGGGVMYT